MDHDRGPVRIRVGHQRLPAQLDQGIGGTLRKRVPAPVGVAPDAMGAPLEGLYHRCPLIGPKIAPQPDAVLALVHRPPQRALLVGLGFLLLGHRPLPAHQRLEGIEVECQGLLQQLCLVV
ncbi:MAG: hypothetical protein H0V77_12425 [Actinobacteria bacterium]|nr:hypothetical protein [Actinomycetota bacterium]